MSWRAVSWRERARARVGDRVDERFRRILAEELVIQNYVTKKELEEELRELVDTQIARENNNAERVYNQYNSLLNRIAGLEDRLYQLENPSEPEEEPVEETFTVEHVTKELNYEELKKGVELVAALTAGSEVWQILGEFDGRTSFFGIVSSEPRARVAVMEAAHKYFYPGEPIERTMFVQVSDETWATDRYKEVIPLIYIDRTGLRARRSDRLWYQVYAGNRTIDAPMNEERL